MPRTIKHDGFVIEQTFDEDDDRDFTVHPVSGMYQNFVKVNMKIDLKNRLMYNYYFDHLHTTWLKSIFPLPDNFVVVRAPLTYNSNSNWRSFKSFLKVPYKPPFTAIESQVEVPVDDNEIIRPTTVQQFEGI